MVFLMNKRYAPFYKWAHRAVQGLPLLGKYMYGQVEALLTATDDPKKTAMIESTCQALISQLKDQGLTDSGSDFLPDHGPEVQKRINDPEMRSLSVWVG